MKQKGEMRAVTHVTGVVIINYKWSDSVFLYLTRHLAAPAKTTGR